MRRLARDESQEKDGRGMRGMEETGERWRHEKDGGDLRRTEEVEEGRRRSKRDGGGQRDRGAE